MRYLHRLAILAPLFILMIGCGDDGPAGASCGGDDPTFDISGTYTERYKCTEGDTCVDADLTSTIVITAINTLNGQYSFSDQGSDWSGTGLLCGTTFVWNASTADYEESGVWEFSDEENFTKTSDYEYTDGGGGTCTGTASQTSTPPEPAPIGGCQ